MKNRPMSGEVSVVTSGAEVVTILDDLAKQLGRRPRVYVMNYKERSRDEIERLIESADICVENAAWQRIDDRSRYVWVNR